MQRNGKATHLPAATLRGPAVAQQAPAVAQQAPAVAQQAPAVAQQAPAVAQQAPSVAEQAPSVAEQVPAVAQQVPAPTSRAPRRSGCAYAAGYRPEASMDARLSAAKTAIESALADGAMAAALAAHGYDAARLAEGLALRDAARDAAQLHHAGAAAQLAATDARDAARERAHAIYIRHVAIARVALREDRSAARLLNLAARKRTQAGWVAQAQQFYANALSSPDVAARLVAYGVAEADLAEGQRLVAEVETAAAAQRQRVEAARAATQAREAAFGALDAWMRDFSAIARVVVAR